MPICSLNYKIFNFNFENTCKTSHTSNFIKLRKSLIDRLIRIFESDYFAIFFEIFDMLSFIM